jgi:hypothetical protein
MEQIFNPNNLQITTKIDMQDIVGHLQYNWMLTLAAMSILLFIYVIFKNFVKFNPDSKFKWIEIEMDMMALVPATFILFICLTFFLKLKGV